MSLGELPERERRVGGFGWSNADPNSTPQQQLSTTKALTGSTTGQSIDLTAKKILTYNTARSYLFFQNRGSVTIFLSIGGNPGNWNGSAPPNAVELPPGAVYEPNTNGQYMLCSDVYAVTSIAGQLLAVIEGVRNF